MDRKKYYAIRGVLLGFALFSCSQANFRGGASSGSPSNANTNGVGNGTSGTPNGVDFDENGNPNPTQNTPGSNTPGTNTPGTNTPGSNTPGANTPGSENPGRIPEECIAGDKLNLEWTGAEKECMVDEGKTFNFNENRCEELPKARFNCDWSTLLGELSKLGLGTSALNTASKDGSKLISCGQSMDGHRIAAQWVLITNLPRVQCKQGTEQKPFVTTGCYTQYKAGEAVPLPTTDENEKRERTYKCLSAI